jgi:hypothetical protein
MITYTSSMEAIYCEELYFGKEHNPFQQHQSYFDHRLSQGVHKDYNEHITTQLEEIDYDLWILTPSINEY